MQEFMVAVSQLRIRAENLAPSLNKIPDVLCRFPRFFEQQLSGSGEVVTPGLTPTVGKKKWKKKQKKTGTKFLEMIATTFVGLS